MLLEDVVLNIPRATIGLPTDNGADGGGSCNSLLTRQKKGGKESFR